ncbi:hypothetical protein SAMN06297382_0213 [Amphiplicatus metriothermophilus]|uniref:Uncharacterized protein n=1 Tax=Amphiplicatus metriothermophilus TaxID=1519374 RepID=A0A239PJI9_9PROT|nr:hypothetical protein [Amphiplicatus metriothermophilus]SNT67720.1 hypothetical protein SAMN06297382_0213 [Amphiplicatus metriothermophilus]
MNAYRPVGSYSSRMKRAQPARVGSCDSRKAGSFEMRLNPARGLDERDLAMVRFARSGRRGSPGARSGRAGAALPGGKEGA